MFFREEEILHAAGEASGEWRCCTLPVRRAASGVCARCREASGEWMIDCALRGGRGGLPLRREACKQKGGKEKEEEERGGRRREGGVRWWRAQKYLPCLLASRTCRGEARPIPSGQRAAVNTPHTFSYTA